MIDRYLSAMTGLHLALQINLSTGITTQRSHESVFLRRWMLRKAKYLAWNGPAWPDAKSLEWISSTGSDSWPRQLCKTFAPHPLVHFSVQCTEVEGCRDGRWQILEFAASIWHRNSINVVVTYLKNVTLFQLWCVFAKRRVTARRLHSLMILAGNVCIFVNADGAALWPP